MYSTIVQKQVYNINTIQKGEKREEKIIANGVIVCEVSCQVLMLANSHRVD